MSELLDSVNAAVSGVATLGGVLSVGKDVEENYRYTNQLYEKQYERQLDFWDKNNEYNSPVAQMARFREAGVNPYVSLGHPNTASYGSVMTPVEPYGYRRAGMFATLQQGLQNYLMLQQARNIGADTNLKDSQVHTQESITALNRVKTFTLKLDGDLKQQLFDFRERINEPLVQTAWQDYNLKVWQTASESRNYEILGCKIRLTNQEYERVELVKESMRKDLKLKDAQIEIYLAQAFATRVQGQLGAAALPYAGALARANASDAQNRAAISYNDANVSANTVDSRIDYSQNRAQISQTQSWEEGIKLSFLSDEKRLGIVGALLHSVFGNY